MAESWGNNNLGKFNEDLVSVPENENILKVSDVNDQGGGDNKIALHTKNSSTHANARALKIEGVAEFLGRAEDNDAVLKIRNCTITNSDNGDGIRLEPDGNNYVLISPSESVLIVSGGLLVSSGITDLHNLLRVHSSVNATNQLRAVQGILVGNDDDGGKIDFWITNNPGDLKLGTESDNTRNVYISSSGNIARVSGTLELFGSTLEVHGVNDLKIGTENQNMTQVQIARTGKTTIIQGKLEVDEGIGNFQVGPSAAAGEIDSGGSAESKQDLKLGTGAGSDSVIIGKQDHTAIVDCNLRVGRNEIGGVHTSRIDAYGHNGQADHLNIGTQNHTTDVRISRSGQKALVLGNLEVNEELRVGPTGSAGQIDAGGTGQAQKLKIGSQNTTANVELGRGGQTIDMIGQERLNGNAVIMNGAANILAANGCGMLFNPNGHPGPNQPCIDFRINGAVVGWVDANGWHNA